MIDGVHFYHLIQEREENEWIEGEEFCLFINVPVLLLFMCIGFFLLFFMIFLGVFLLSFFLLAGGEGGRGCVIYL